MAHTAKSPPGRTGGARKSDCLEAVRSETNPPKQDPQASLPSRAALARQWPGLRVNRLTWRWRDDATGRGGDSIESLLAFLNAWGGRR